MPRAINLASMGRGRKFTRSRSARRVAALAVQFSDPLLSLTTQQVADLWFDGRHETALEYLKELGRQGKIEVLWYDNRSPVWGQKI